MTHGPPIATPFDMFSGSTQSSKLKQHERNSHVEKTAVLVYPDMPDALQDPSAGFHFNPLKH